MTSVSGRLFFTRETFYFGLSVTTELWVSDGTTGGTTLVKKAAPEEVYSFWPRFLQDGGNQLVFNSNFPGATNELVWTSDGTAAGTKPLQLAGEYVVGGRYGAVVGHRLFIAGGSLGVGVELASLNTLTAPAKVGDFDRNDTVNQADYNRWFASFGSMVNLAADGNALGGVDAADYTLWRDNQTTVSTDYNRDGTVSTADRTFWAANFGAISGVGLQADGAVNGTIDAADYTVWRDAYVPPASTDFNGNGRVDLADLDSWQGNFGATTNPGLQADGNSNGIVDTADYTLWRDAYLPPTVTAPTIAVATAPVSSAPISALAPAPPLAGDLALPPPKNAQPIASSPPRRTDLLLAARDAAFADLGHEDNPSSITTHKLAPRKFAPLKTAVKGKL